MMRMRLAILSSLIAMAYASSAQADIGYKQNKQNQVIELSGLNDDATCTPTPLAGKIISREFEPDNLTVKSFIIENADGTRDDINVFPPDPSGEFMRGILYNGLQRLTKPGRVVRGRAVLCGVSGHVIMLDEIR
jgi:hypothetical protein